MQRAQFECAIDAGNWESTIVEDVGSAMSMPASILREIVAYTATAHRRPTPPSYVCNTATQFGGLFLIMREVRERWGTATDPSLTRTLQWLTLAACAGGERLEQVLGDPVFRTIFGVPAAATLREIALQLRTVDARRCAEAVRAWQLDGPGLSRQPDEKPWVTVDRRLGLSSRWGHVFALAARRALGTFARRLPGFAAASPRYIWDNFLSADASVEHEEERVVVRYGRPPLHLVLTLTGMTRGLTAGEDLRGRPVVVFVKE
jgi:hypothetical protein